MSAPAPAPDTADTVRTGGCRCGAVRFRAAGKPLWIAHCHCTDCRKQISAGMATWLGYKAGQVTWERGAPKTYASSPGVARGFCGTCGTPLSYEGGRWAGETHLLAGALDDPASIRPRAHVFVGDGMPWIVLNDGLRRFAKTGEDGPPLP